MCGICGWINQHPLINDNRSILERMNATLTHRGPDEGGAVLLENAGLAMRRLSIIDLATGQQPIANESETCWIVFNGEIYNFLELRQELEAKGHYFRTRTDTEVILKAYEAWGTECVHLLRGMFAFAIYDRPKNQLFLARDRAGQKPLYYYQEANRFIFASEIKALLAHRSVPRRVNRPVIPLYLAYGYVPAPDTMFEKIYELPPGHAAIARSGQLSIYPYWDVSYPSNPDRQLSESEIIPKLQGLLKESVRLRLISDVPLGAFLSGGVDSTAIVAYMAQLMSQPVRTFAIGFADDPSFNELEYARMAANTYGTDHHEFIVRPDAIELLPKLVWHYDQPFADSSAIPTYLVSQLTRQQVTVALTGDGGDELFAGYERFAASRLAEIYRRTPKLLQTALIYLLRNLPESTGYNSFVRRTRRFVESAPLPLAQRYLGWVGIFQTNFIRELMADRFELDLASHFQTYLVEPVRECNPLSQLLYVNTKTYLSGDLLVKSDRMSMANSLEARCPFLDHQLIEFAASIPENLKLKGLATKYILKKALEGIVPSHIIHRQKHGFGVPIGRWFRTDLKDYVPELLLSGDSLNRGYFRPEFLRQLIDEHQSGKCDRAHQLWTLLTLEIWHRLFIDS
ncbi:MAG: asparagine synthase (glutamine-hydrolyzing) [Hormoscilla sp.]